MYVSAFKKPHDAWKKVASGKFPMPEELKGHEQVWLKIAKRLKFDPSRGVTQKAPVIGGRRRYHHRPLTTWALPQRKGYLTITTDPMEAKSWNRLKGKRHIAMPRIKDVFVLQLNDGRKYYAIQHEPLTYPPDDDWYLFIDTFFRWRAMSKDALKPAQPSDVREFLEWVLDVEGTDKKAHKRRRQDAVIPFDMGKKRDNKIKKVKEALWRDAGLQEKVKWAMKTIKFLKANKVKHSDLDPSNLGKTARGRTVITNIAESRSQGKNIGRTGRVSGRTEEMTRKDAIKGGLISKWYRKGPETNEERSERAKRAAQTRKINHIPVEVTINGVKVKGYLDNYGGKISDTYVRFNTYRSLGKLKNLDMYFDNPYGFSKGAPKKLGDLLKRGVRVYLNKDRTGDWTLNAAPPSDNLWRSAPLKVKIRKTAVPDPIDFGQMAASMSGRDVMSAVSACLTKDNVLSASSENVKDISRAVFGSAESRLALFLAANNIPLMAVDAKTERSAKRGARAIRESRCGRISGELYNAIVKSIA